MLNSAKCRDFMKLTVILYRVAVKLYKFRLSPGLKAFTFMFAFALMTPLGTFLAEQMHFAQHYSKEISAVVVGILFHISSTIIFESNEGHKFNLAKITMIVLGFLLAFFMEMGHSH